MPFLLLVHIQNARKSIRANRLRSALTMLGLTIGVASITTILSLSAGASQIVSGQVDALGGNIAVIRPGVTNDDYLKDIRTLGNTKLPTSTLTVADVSAVSQVKNVSMVAPIMVLSGAVKGVNQAPTSTPIVATTPQLKTISNMQVQEGQFLDPTLNPNTAVIGPQLSINTFGTDQSIGKIIDIKGVPFTIIGVLKRTNTPVNYNNVDFDNAVIINFDSGRELNQNTAYIQQINIKSTSVSDLAGVITEINKTLLKTHLGQVDFSVLTGSKISQPTSQIFMAIAGASIAVAAISLLVGGVGIMNIMLVSVVERTREIGIRKALGATSGAIVGQFMVEAMVMSVAGGVFGCILGYLLAIAISTFLTFDPAFNIQTVAVAIFISIIIGTLFGVYPAIRAARKDPISALKTYE